jgi:DNA-binding HxlR family transcriptional regulator
MAEIPRRNPLTDCPMTAALAALGGKWKLIIVSWLAEGPQHFAGLRQLMPTISQKVLTEQLRELIADGVVRREATGQAPAPVIYSLTDYGRTVEPVTEAVRAWGRGHLSRAGVETPLNSYGAVFSGAPGRAKAIT